LFDLMRERGENPDAPRPTPPQPARPATTPAQSKPPVAPPSASESGPSVSTKQTAWDSSGGVSRAERSAAAMLDNEVQDESGIRISSPMFYTLIVIAFVLILGAWTVGYQRGNAAGKKAIEPYVRDQPVVRPVQTGSQGTAGDPSLANPEQSNTAKPRTDSNTPPTSNSTLGDVGVMSPSGFLANDPRQSQFNYLVLATLNTEQTADAIAFMYSNSVEVIGVPVVDSRSSSANNPSLYTLYSLGVAIPSNQWNAMSTQRTQHQSLIVNLGSRWQRERRGGSDFSQAFWEKYE